MVLATLATVLAGTALVAYFIYRRYPWLRYDFRFLRIMGKAAITYERYVRQNKLIVDLFEEQVRIRPQKTFLIHHDKYYSYSWTDSQANRVAHLARKLGFKRGDVVSMMMYNEPAFIYTYLGLMKVGVQPAFINTNLRSKSLVHCVNISEARVMFVGHGSELVSALYDISSDLTAQGITVYALEPNSNQLKNGFQSFDEVMAASSEEAIPGSERDGVSVFDPACYIYPSGTTGLPKAAVVSHAKLLKATGFFHTANTTEDDIVYTALPLYHSAALCIGLGGTINFGCTMVLREKFSATHYWEDCRKYNVTITQYIGELCRYLLARPPSPDDRNHKVRSAIGNGLRRDIWVQFKERFGVSQIVELYAATEGNAGSINFFNKVGAVGRISPLLQKLYPMYLIKYDYETALPIRNKNGFCMHAKPGDAGLLIMIIRKSMEYDGYKGNRKLTQNKVVENVFRKGDKFFNSGDLLTLDEDYFLYFSDRLGDTFRWKGENVSTIEVSNLLSDIKWIEDANVYGVEVPGQDGKAGMASLLLRDSEEISPSRLEELYRKCEELLPSYARPRFIRIQPHLEVTGTLKHRKVELVKEGFDPAKCEGEPLFCWEPTKHTYIPLDDKVYQQVVNGQMRL